MNTEILNLGLGIGLGATAIWLIFELWPVVVFSVAGYIMFTAFEKKQQQIWQEYDACKDYGKTMK